MDAPHTPTSYGPGADGRAHPITCGPDDPVAAYLRSHPAGALLTSSYRRELEQLATDRGLRSPVFFDDPVHQPPGEAAALSCLLDLVAVGLFRAVLVPGLFVFAADDGEAAAVAGRFRARGCEVIELSG